MTEAGRGAPGGVDGMRSVWGYLLKGALLAISGWFGTLFADNILELRRLNALQTMAEGAVRVLQTQNLALRREAKALEEDNFFVELTLRRKLRWARPDERPLRSSPPRGKQQHLQLAHNRAEAAPARPASGEHDTGGDIEDDAHAPVTWDR